MTDVEQTIHRLRQQAEQYRQARAAAEHQRGVAEAASTQVLTDMQAEFGVGTVPEAQALLAKLDEQVAAEVAAVERQLAAANGGAA